MKPRTLKQNLLFFLNPFDARYEDLPKGNLGLNILRDCTAGLVVAMVAIPLAMGFAIASGLRPEQGIVGGAIAGLVGALFGGSKYQVYGPTAAFIPIIGAIMQSHDHAYLVLCSILAGIVLMILGLLRFGRIVNLVPHAIVVGFTIGIAITIALSQIGEVLGLHAKLGYGFFEKIQGIVTHIGEFNAYALLLSLAVLVMTKVMLRISVYLPGPLIAVAVGTLLSSTIWTDKHLTLVHQKYGEIPDNLLVFTPHSSQGFQYPYALAYYVLAIVFVSSIESLLCSRMADRLANNTGTPFHPNKELWGQGLVQIIVPLANGFPHTGALARTATSIKLGAISPLAGIMKCIFKLLLAFFLADSLEKVPMACIAGILLYVAMNMVKAEEVREVQAQGTFQKGLMIVTAIAVVLTDFLTGVLTALAIAIFRALTHVQVTCTADEGFVRVRVFGSLTFVSAAQVLIRLADVAPAQDVVLDLEVHVMDQAGWKAIQDWMRGYRQEGGRVSLGGLHEDSFP